MRVIEVEMVQAIRALKNWSKDNTQVAVRDGVASVYLFGNHIADVMGREVAVNQTTLAKWPTRTTKSRLRALQTISI